VHHSYPSFQTPNSVFLIVPVREFTKEELKELHDMSQYLQEQKEPYVSTFLMTKNNELTFEHEGRVYAVLKSVSHLSNRTFQIGTELARFHQKGRQFPYQVKEMSRLGGWKDFWEKRLDQLEQFWRQKAYTHPLEPFEKKFIESFPYYLGLSENAIQYLVDTELDDKPEASDSGTICYKRMTHDKWSQESLLKLPTDWVLDHPARDLAEYMRNTFMVFRNDRFEQGFLCLQQYEEVCPLSSFAKRLIYSRLLFPLHYFETVEGYYISPESERDFYEDRLDQLLYDSERYEQFLRTFHERAGMRNPRVQIPVINWLLRH
jgi:spore coat protein YutH